MDKLGEDPFRDMRKLATPRPVIFDVGANTGETLEKFRAHFKRAVIHAFEPAPSPFGELVKRATEVPNLRLNNFALGPKRERRILNENQRSTMSSFLELGPAGWGSVKERRPVEVDTLDGYCEREGVSHIDILKLDTQGFDLEVLKGGEGLIREGRVHLLFMEVIFSEMYKGLPSFDEVYRFVTERGFRLVSFYDFYYQKRMAGWADALFVNPH